MKKSIIILFISIILLFLLTCDIYNKSIPEYLDQYTNSASVAEHTFSNGTLLNPQSQIYPGLIKPDSVIDLKLRNPKNYQLVSYLEYKQGDAWIPFSRVEASGDYSTVEYTSGDFVGLVITVKYIPTDQIKISIAGAKAGESYRLKLKVNDRETKREFDPYELPVLKCSDYPEEIKNFSISAGGGGNGLKVKWGQSLRNLGSGDRADADSLVISCPSLGIPPETYTRSFDGTSWSEWSPDVVKILRTGDDYSVIIGSHVPLVPGALYNVSLRFKNEAGVVREISKALTGDPYCARVTIGGSDTLYTTLDGAFDYIDKQGATVATVTILNDIDDQGAIIIPGSGAGSNITLLSEGGNTIQLGQKGALFEVLAGGSLKIGGTTSGTVILGGINNNDTALVYARGTLEINANTIIRDNTNYGNGGGVYIHGGTVTMNGGFIENNIAISTGSNGWSAGVEVYSGTFTMNSGTIRNNQAVMGGGVYVWSSGAFNMNAGTIENNTASSNGGGVYVSGGTFNMNGGTIENNTANSNGGGVYTSGGTFNMEGSARVTLSGDNTTGKNDISTSRINITNNFIPTGTGDVARITPQSYTPNSQILYGTLGVNTTRFVLTQRTNEQWSIGSAGQLVRSIESVAITNVVAPIPNNAPVTTATVTTNPANAVMTPVVVSWAPGHNPFQAGVDYIATIIVDVLNPGYTFNDISSATINGAVATVINNGDKITLSRNFNKVDPVVTWPTPSSITATYGQALSAVSLAGVTNPGGTLGSFSWTTPGTAVGNAGSQTHSMTFTPTDQATYNVITANVVITVNKANPVVNWPTGLTATYGQTLSNVTLPGNGTGTSGTFAWVAAGTTDVGTVGPQSYSVTFTPNDTDNYNIPAAQNVTITVLQFTPNVTWSASAITYEALLSTSILTGSSATGVGGATITGTFAWTNGSTIPTVANTGYQATFTPTNANYATVTNNNVPITVNPAPITSAVIAGITTPATGGTPTPTANVAVTPAGAANTTAAVTWNPVHNPFRGGTQYTASVTLAANTNYVFTGLSNATINGTAANITNVTTTSATISYQFAATAPLVVTFNGNGGTPATSTWTVPSTTTTVGTANMPANPQRTGYTFNNWNTQPNGSGTAFTGNTTVTVNITVYAQYTANTYTVNFYGGSISGVTGSTASQNFTYDASQALRANGFTRTGFILKGWSTSSTVGIGGAINYNPGQTVSNLAASGAINLYAVWDFRWNIGDQGPENTGMIFYRSTTGFNVNGIGTCYYLEVQNGYRPASYQYTIPLLTAFAGSESGLGSGYRNTQYLLAIGNAPAAETAGESFAGGWFLPSIDELALLYQQRTHQDIKFSLGDTGSGPFTSFWSSSDTGTSSTSAYIMYFNGANTGSTAARPKSESHNIVSVRAH